MKNRALMIVAAVALSLVATPTLACSIGRKTPNEIHAEQARDLRASDLIFLARVSGSGVADQPEFDQPDNIIFYEPIQLVSRDGELPESLSVAVFYCLPLPPIGETHVILMRAADLSGTPALTSTVLGDYEVSDIYDSGLRERVERALRRANIQ